MNDRKSVAILLVEDNEGDVILVREALREHKLSNTLTVKRDGEQAIAYLREVRTDPTQTPDLILLDLNLPRRNGHEVLQMIREDKHLETIPVVMLTSSEAQEDVLQSYRLRANCYISKPVDFEQFMKVVQAVDDFWFSIVRLPQ